MSSELKYLGIPSDETEWLKYKGTCILFAGKEKQLDEDMDDYDQWIMESEEETKVRLTDGLKQMGVKCESISFKWCDRDNGQRLCECIVYYNKPYQVYISEMFIKGLSSFEFDKDNTNSELEFCLIERM